MSYFFSIDSEDSIKALHPQSVYCNWGLWGKRGVQRVPRFPTEMSRKALQAAPSHSGTLGNKEERTDPSATRLCRKTRKGTVKKYSSPGATLNLVSG